MNKDISIFVGSNNSGKTSVAQALQFFLLGTRQRVSLYDISANKWSDIDAFEQEDQGASLPILALDLWFEVNENTLHRVIDLLPSLDWKGTKVGLRITYGPTNESEILTRFRERQKRTLQARTAKSELGSESEFVSSPRSLREYLESDIKREYDFRYFVLDYSKFDSNYKQRKNYEPHELIQDQGRAGRDIINSLLKADFLFAQRYLSDSASSSRTEDLSRHLSRYYARNLEKRSEDFNAIEALAESEALLNRHLKQVFSETLERLADLGYPGIANPQLIIKSALNPATVMSSADGAQVHYALDEGEVTLPDRYSGLGFKNLIYMVIELLDTHAQWVAMEENRPPLHLVFVEEPEAHLHTQLQQVFANKVLDLLSVEEGETESFRSQVTLTTHSPHILFERGFLPIRYFRRENSGISQTSTVLNLTEFYRNAADVDRDFLERYLKLTHCDLFFADAAILVEGNVERLLMRQMIQKVAPGLQSCYLCILEIGGAFGNIFKSLIDFLEIPTLIVTDLDSVFPRKSKDGTSDIIIEDNDKKGSDEPTTARKICMPETVDAITSNQMLRQWLPGLESIDELLKIGSDKKVLAIGANQSAEVRVTYPCTVELEWRNERLRRAGRTLEVAFAYENLEWTQQRENWNLHLNVSNCNSIDNLSQRLHEKVHGSSFKKTDFALALLSKNPSDWVVPQYIREGLLWLEVILKTAGGSELKNTPALDEAASKVGPE